MSGRSTGAVKSRCQAQCKSGAAASAFGAESVSAQLSAQTLCIAFSPLPVQTSSSLARMHVGSKP